MSKLNEVKKIIDKISPTFCLAKWHHTNIYLQTGETHSCYHPPPHKIPESNLTDRPNILHNTPEKAFQRQEMLDGIRCEGCSYCWDVEDNGGVSDRHVRNATIYTEDRMKDVLEKGSLMPINPEYIEISFSNTCNMMCGYCHPKASSSYQSEIERFGPLGHASNDMKIYSRYEDNPYTTAWWKWWDEMSKTLNILRITGGEPLHQPETSKMLDILEKDPRPNLELNINSNLHVPDMLFAKYISKINKLYADNCIKKFKLFTSMDTWGKQAEYIRHGLSLINWESNLLMFLMDTNFSVTIMVTYNALSVPGFIKFLEKVVEWREKFPDRIRLSISHLTEPKLWSIHNMPKEHYHYMVNCLDYMTLFGFSKLEIDNFESVVKYYSAEEILSTWPQDFLDYFHELDRRRGTDIHTTFGDFLA